MFTTTIISVNKITYIHNVNCKLEIVLNGNSIKRTCCVAQHWAKFSSGTKYILLMNQVPFLEEEEEVHATFICCLWKGIK
jgi:hypothetical protein